ncbi:restriction endonuclease subunit S [Leyella stercorea]|jgi:type I restriction enzyme S subunit|uniref:restriction endonuclease subunit S n=1 Tax=Leyella stercorea TaxID=363265 RepID=UPI003AAEF472
MNTKALRQKILDLAIHGKLVPQDPNDEPASVLLERIRDEKERLIKEGKIKRPKKTKTTSDKPHYENVPFEVPSSWVWTTVGDIAESNIGLTYKPSDICDDGVPVYRSNNIQNRRIDKTELVRVNAKILDKQYLAVGDLLICARNGSRRLVGKCALIENLSEPSAFGAFMAVCRSAYNPWIYLLLNTGYFNRYLDDSNSTAINQVTQSMLLAFRVPFPPKKEQDRIIYEISKWFDLIDTIEKSKEEMQVIISTTKSKILDLAIHGKLVPQDPTDEPASELLKRINPKAEIISDNGHYQKLPEGWCLTTLGSIGLWQSGATPSRLQKEYYGGNIPWLKTGDLNDGIIINIPEFITEKALAETSVKLNPSGSVLIAMYGATIGKVGILSFPATTNQACCACVDYKLEQMYLFYFLLANRENFIRMGGGGAQPNISKEKIINTVISLPPLKEQHRIVAKIEEIFAQLDAIEASL